MIRLLFVVFVLLRGLTVATASPPSLAIVPDQSFYRPNSTVRLLISSAPGVRIEADITVGPDVVAVLAAPIENGSAELTWQPPPDAPRGYGVDVRAYDDAGAALAAASTAFDVLAHWTDAPRYGFFSDFRAGRSGDEATTAWLLRHHLNGIQYYDWQYRWEALLPETDEFSDGLGRPQSMATIRRLIDLTHEIGTASMPYTAIYGVSMAFYRQHPEWALVDAHGEPHLFGENFMAILDPTPGSAWNAHLLAEFADVLQNTAFDGIHVDQYGAPKTAFNTRGEPVDLADVFPAFINQTAEIVQAERGDEGAVLFNAVGNWPVETVAPAQQDGVYIEVWPPYNDYADLNRIIVNAQQWGEGKPVILAAYIPAERTNNWRLANAIIFASGGAHIETGEPGAMLADPYFPNFRAIAPEDQPVFTRYYDFMVRYENVLSIATTAAPDARHRLEVGDLRTRGIRARDRIVPVVRQGSGFEAFNLINFAGVRQSDWNQPDTEMPTALTDVAVAIPVERPVARVWAASPDQPETMAAQALDYTVADGQLHLTLPQLAYWTLIVVEYES